MTPDLHLPNVTLWACSWSDNDPMRRRTVAVLDYCQRHIRFKRIVYFTLLPAKVPKGVELIQIPKLDMSEWNVFANRVVPAMVPEADFLMSVHDDGFPVDFSRWEKEFLAYDYIGAPWADGVVGNAGFNIESRKLLQAKMQLPFCQPENGKHIASDVYLCRKYRKELEGMGIRFAPRDVAMRFSSEQIGHPWPSFGFHGRVGGQPDKYFIGWGKLLSEL